MTLWLASSKVLALDVFMRNQPIQAVLPQLAAELEQSVIIDESIAANVTLAIRDATWPEIMAAVAAQLQLQLSWQGEIAILAPKAVAASAEASVLEDQCDHAIWHLKHAKAVTVGTYLKQYFSDLGTIIDPRTNAIMTRYCGAPETLAMAFEWLDSPTRQIEIGAEIAQVSDSVQEQLGVNWHARLLDQSQTSILGDIDLGLAAAPVNLGISGVTGNLALSATLDWLERQGSASVLARPKIVTAEGQPARIESGTEVPYQVVDDDNVSVEFRQAGLMLEVTPQVKDETTLLLNLKIHQDSVGEMVNGVPSIETNRVQTQVEVKNGETLVLGGIYREETFINVNKVPVLGDVPVMGALFRQETEQQEKVELLVFITPKLLKMSVN
ncbi:type II and III secretion system protein [Marinomonas ostreistagni]|uniref:type II and III secretion system protein n=1 Tax=Marinomonas ostreistagni TaxID=359209 RepID=UPI001EF31A5D|nr:type II and III secretion system protein [Marinomonas ostreistagni]